MRNNRSLADTLKQCLLAAIIVAAVAPILSGCAKKAGSSPEIAPASFRADPSKMTPAEKQKLDEMMRAAGTPSGK
jgi:hypothetical protein